MSHMSKHTWTGIPLWRQFQNSLSGFTTGIYLNPKSPNNKRNTMSYSVSPVLAIVFKYCSKTGGISPFFFSKSVNKMNSMKMYNETGFRHLSKTDLTTTQTHKTYRLKRLISPLDCPCLFLSTQPWRSNNGAGGNDVRISLLNIPKGGGDLSINRFNDYPIYFCVLS